MSGNQKDWLSRKEAAAYLARLGFSFSPGTLANMAANNNQGNGPPYLRLRWSTVRYRREDLDAWVQQQSVRVR